VAWGFGRYAPDASAGMGRDSRLTIRDGMITLAGRYMILLRPEEDQAVRNFRISVSPLEILHLFQNGVGIPIEFRILGVLGPGKISPEHHLPVPILLV